MGFLFALILGIFFAFIIGLIGGGAIYLLWNHVVIYIFAVKPVSFWLAFGIFFLISFIKQIFSKNDSKND